MNPFNFPQVQQVISQSPGIVVLHSGGMDSAAMLAFLVHQETVFERLRNNKLQITCVNFDYHQRNYADEARSAFNLVTQLRDELKLNRLWKDGSKCPLLYEAINIRFIGTQLMPLDHPLFYDNSSDNSIDNSSDNSSDNSNDNSTDVTHCTVPQRNLVMLAIAGMLAEVRNCNILVHGANADDKVYRDCRAEFFNSVTRAIGDGLVNVPANVSLYAGKANGIHISIPLLEWTKEEILFNLAEEGLLKYVRESYTCYRGRKRACGKCPACKQRIAAFQKVGYADPMEYKIPITFLECKSVPQLNK